MIKFIKLTGILINVNNINFITIKPNKYYINLKSKRFNGFSFMFFGLLETYGDEIALCEKKNTTDYKIVSEWIKQN